MNRVLVLLALVSALTACDDTEADPARAATTVVVEVSSVDAARTRELEVRLFVGGTVHEGRIRASDGAPFDLRTPQTIELEVPGPRVVGHVDARALEEATGMWVSACAGVALEGHGRLRVALHPSHYMERPVTCPIGFAVADDPAPVSGRWVPMASTDARPPWRSKPVWTGSELLVFQEGALLRWDPASDAWRMGASHPVFPGEREAMHATWTGQELVVLAAGGHAYDPARDSWRTIPWDGVRAAAPRLGAVFWTGRDLALLGEHDLRLAAWRLDPGTGALGAPSLAEVGWRDGIPVVACADELVTWGRAGYDAVGLAHRYDPATHAWQQMNETGAPEPRFGHAMVCAGREVIVWGGERIRGSTLRMRSGGRYDLDADRWRPVALDGAPRGRRFAGAVWTGREVIVWGGEDGQLEDLQTGGRYDPAADLWGALPADGAPTPRIVPALLWTGGEVIVWSGEADWRLPEPGRLAP